MAKLVFKEEFELEVGEQKYSGFVSDFNKKQKKEFKKLSENEREKSNSLAVIQKEIKSLHRKIENKTKLEKWEDIEILLENVEVLENKQANTLKDLEENDSLDLLFKKRIEMTVESVSLKEILDAGENYGYQNVFETILDGAKEKKKAN